MKRAFLVCVLGLTAVLAGSAPLGMRLWRQQPSTAGSRAIKVSVVPSSRSERGPQSADSARGVRAESRTSPDSSLKLPLEFEANRGQAPAEYGFVAHGPTYALGLSPTDIALSLHRPRVSSRAKLLSAAFDPDAMQAMDHSQLHLRLLGASTSASVAGLQPRPGVSNYFLGNDPSKWQTHVPHFGQVEIAGAYPGIDLVFYGNPQQLEYDFRIAPGADPRAVRLDAAGANSVTLDAEGNLVLGTAAGEVQLKHPEAYQEMDGVRKPIDSAFRLVAKSTVEFVVGAYDRSRPLIIDPVLLYAVSIGGSNGNQGIGMDVDAAGNAYATGNTCSSDFPSTAGSFGTTTTNIELPYCQDVFVVKLDPTASTLLYSDYIGGSLAQSGSHIAVDSSGDAYVTGATGSTNFPTINNIGTSAPVPCSLSKSGLNCPAGFIFKLSPDGSQLLFSSLLGGSQSSGGFQVKLNPVTGDLLVLGGTSASDFKPAPTTLQSTFSGSSCANGTPCENTFLLGLNPATGALKYGTFLGGTGYTVLTGLSTDTAGDIYLTGSANGALSSSLGTVTHTYAPTGPTAGGADAVVARLHLAGSTLSTAYMTLIQGELDDGGADVTLDSSGNAYVIGSTASLHLPVTAGAFQSANTNAGGNSCQLLAPIAQLLPMTCGTAFVAKLNSTGALSFLTYLGGNNQTWGQAIGVDALGNIWLTGVTSASDFPFSSDAYSLAGISVPGQYNPHNPFLAQMSNNGSMLPFASPIATSPGQATDIKIDSNNNVYLVGYASGVPTTPNVYPANPEVYNPVFVQKWNPGPQPVLQLSSSLLTFPPTPFGGISASQTVTAQNTGGGALELNLQLANTLFDLTPPPGFVESDNCGTSIAANSSCTITVTFEPGAPSSTCLAAAGCFTDSPSGEIILQTNAATGTQSIQLEGTTGHGAALSATPDPIVFPPQAAGTTSAAMEVFLLSGGDVSLKIGSATIGGPNAADFQVSSMGTCTSAVPLGESGCYVELVFNPAVSATGTRTASLVLTDNAGDSPQSIPIAGLVTSAGAGLLVSPSSVYTGPAVIGATDVNAQGLITLTNPSTDTSVQLTSLTVGGANKTDFQIVPEAFPTTLPLVIAKGASLGLAVNFLPVAGAEGLRNATLTLGTNPSISGLPVIALSGDAVTNTDGILTYISVPSPQNFGSLQIGESSLAGNNLLSIGAKELGSSECANGVTTFCGGPLTITSFVTDLSDYAVVVPQQNGYCTMPPLTIPAGDACSFQLVFSPTNAGNRNTTLTINSNDPIGPTTIPLIGSGLALPLGNLSVTALDFGNSAIGVASPALSVTLQNFGQSSLTVSAVSTSANYAVTSNTCTMPLAPNATCTIGVAFTPPSAGAFSGTLMITDNDYFGAQQTVTLAGTGATGALLRITPNTINFGSQGIGTASAAQTITLVNTGNATVSFPANALRINNPDYILQSTTCGTTLAQEASCTVILKFKPSMLFVDSGSLLIADNAVGGPQPIYFAGFGIPIGGNPTATITSNLNPSASGQPVTFTVTIAGTSGSSPVPTGTLTFYDSINLLGTIALNSSGKASVTTASLGTGMQTISGIYSGDTNYASVNTPVVTQVVNPATNTSTITALISSVNPSTNGQLVIFTATVTGVGSDTPIPGGAVTFMDGTTTLGTATMNGAAQALFSYNSPSSGSHSITAVYAGNGTYAGSTSTALSQVVNVSTKTATTTSLSSSANPATTGQSVVFTATVAGVGSNTPVPTGTVTFMDGTTTLATQALNGSAQAIFTTSALAAGSHSITVAYSSDATYAVSISAALTQIVNAPAKTGTTTSLSSSLNPATTGQSVTFTATVTGVGSNMPVPTGTITFLDGTTALGTQALNGSAQASLTTSALTAGSHPMTAVYSADTNYAASTTAALTQIVNAAVKTNTTTSLLSSANPAPTGQSVIFTATVAGVGSNTPVPTGTVTFLDGTTTLGMSTLNGSAQASLTTSALAVGSHSITAVYGADANYAASTSTAVAEVVNTPAKTNTTTSVSSSANPATIGQSVVFTATVAGVGSNSPVPTGMATFLDGTTTLGTGTLNSAGTATFATTTLVAGVHPITVQYGGDTNYLGSTSGALSQTVNAAASYTIAFNPTTLTVTRGQSGTVTITVTPIGGFNQSVALACSGLPILTTCTFNPLTVASANGTSTLTIATDVGSASNGSGPAERPASGRIWSAGLILGVGFLATLRGRRRLAGKNLRTALLLLGFALLGGVVALQLAGCGGKGGNSSPAPTQTPTGSSSIMVTASAGSQTQTASFTLIVQ
jgi:Bacterial Ig-like domain (group 3)/Beta-propeller repeat